MPTNYGGRRRPFARFQSGATALCLCLCLATGGCTAGSSTTAFGASAATTAVRSPIADSTAAESTVAGSTAAGSPYPPADTAAIRSAVDAVNAAAGGQVQAQRATLNALVLPRSASAQAACPPATTTIRLEPVYQDLRTADPADTDPASSAPEGATAYLLPTLITIFTGPRITGTDLTTLRLFVSDGKANTSVLCVS